MCSNLAALLKRCEYSTLGLKVWGKKRKDKNKGHKYDVEVKFSVKPGIKSHKPTLMFPEQTNLSDRKKFFEWDFKQQLMVKRIFKGMHDIIGIILANIKISADMYC